MALPQNAVSRAEAGPPRALPGHAAVGSRPSGPARQLPLPGWTAYAPPSLAALAPVSSVRTARYVGSQPVTISSDRAQTPRCGPRREAPAALRTAAKEGAQPAVGVWGRPLDSRGGEIAGGDAMSVVPATRTGRRRPVGPRSGPLWAERLGVVGRGSRTLGKPRPEQGRSGAPPRSRPRSLALHGLRLSPPHPAALRSAPAGSFLGNTENPDCW